MNRVTVIQKIIRRVNARVYLEIGIQQGKCFLEIKAPKKMGVDPSFSIGPIRKLIFHLLNIRNFFNEYYAMTSDDFFRAKSDVLKQGGLDVVFIDGLHTYGQTLKDVNNSLEYLNKGGVIVMHDCNPRSATIAHPANSFEHAESMHLPDWTKEWCGDVWKTVVHLRASRSDLNIFVLDCDCGLGIITKAAPENTLKYSAQELRNLSYGDLEKDRINILNLKDQKYFKGFIKTLKPILKS